MMNQYEYEVMKWEAEVLIDSLLKLTRSGEMKWELMEYEPLMLIEADDLYISQKIVAKAVYEDDQYCAGLMDTMEVFPGTGHVETVCLMSRVEGK